MFDVKLKLYWIFRKSLSWQNFEFHANFASEVLLEVEYNMPIAQSISYILSF